MIDGGGEGLSLTDFVVFCGDVGYRSQILRFICENTGRWLSSSMWLLGVFADEFCYGYGEASGA